MAIENNILIPIDSIKEFCQRHHIHKLSLFGSVLGDNFKRDSDIDVLVEFEPDAVVGWKIVGMREEIQEILGREVDFLTVDSLSPSFRDEVLAQAKLIYEET